MSQHTPGPWAAVTDPGDKRPGTIIAGDRRTGTKVAFPAWSGVDPETTIANAVLIAESPNLLAALRGTALRIVEGHGDDDGLCWCEWYDGHEPACEAARAAIAKATGGQP